VIYFLRHTKTGLIKIGTTNNLDTRMYFLRKQYGELELLGLIAGYENEENELHTQFRELNVRRALTGREWFKPAKELIAYIEKYASMERPLPIGSRKRSNFISSVPIVYKRLVVSTEVQTMYKDLTSGAKVTYDELLQFLAEEIGAQINEPEANLGAGLRMREKLAEWKKQRGKEEETEQ
jgi:hypothetical protein